MKKILLTTLISGMVAGSLFASSCNSNNCETVKSLKLNLSSVELADASSEGMYGIGLGITKYKPTGLMYGGDLDFGYAKYDDLKLYSYSVSGKVGYHYNKMGIYALAVMDAQSAAEKAGLGFGGGIGAEYRAHNDFAVSIDYTMNKIKNNDKMGDYDFDKVGISLKYLF